jgi:hypothetical protein
LLIGTLITGFIFRQQLIGLLRPAGNGSDNGDQPENPILPRTKEERVKELVAEIEARIKANLG